MTIISLIACIGILLILCINIAFITGTFGRIGAAKSSFWAAGLVFVVMLVAAGLILAFDKIIYGG